ncbi:MAG TPA: N-acetyl-gamma-glutamyl-phosphate reductase [Candidatus Omnitrophota bacterium]|nr:N-acetyl-gamma-glutamyl-phosphate reductase [Candidatus Omnitrophota bacterium]HPD85346.1 N-acetyl-gamma-glutamyl-phosphate reductase [Candidatus Omnitrophota bacterium]HRZ04153.1 N-acetyl-gamma-glutamyl-phosphate reductase [Candidatus Omnitrophota bacterium]
MVRVGIVGISGYSGETALKLLLNHPQVRITYVSANNTTGKIDDILPSLNGRTNLTCEKYNAQQAIALCDVLILAVPHTIAQQITPGLLKAKKKVIDLSADYRLKDPNVFKKWYGTAHTDTTNLKKAAYGLPELYRSDIKKATLVANPGCYPTSAILSLAPLVAAKTEGIKSIIIDAKSGVSGAGKKAALALMFSEVNENFKAYKVFAHQHTPEITTYLSKLAGKNIELTFITHLIPINRGILETAYVQFAGAVEAKTLHDLYTKFYKKEKFIRLLKLGQQPETKNVLGTNFCDIAISVSENKKLAVITSAIDNLMKGASGQAVQNLNIMCGFDETAGLL